MRKVTYLDRIREWVNGPGRASQLWLGKHCVVAAWLGLLLAFFSPPRGAGISLCWFQDATGLPCPGCGLTRSLSCALRGMFLESWYYHPMGLFIFALFVFTAVQSLFPGSCRARLTAYMQSRPVFFNTLYLTFVAAFVSFGVVRALLHCGAWW